MPLMGEKGRALHEEHRKPLPADIRHRVLAVLTAAPVRQPGAGLLHPRYQALKRPHTQLESAAPRFGNCRNASRFNLSHPPTQIAKIRIAGLGQTWLTGVAGVGMASPEYVWTSVLE